MKIPSLCILLFSVLVITGQDKYPQDVFRSPLNIPLVLAGTFGELRSNHFHAGIDIKTQQRQGLPVHAIGNGTITRIKVGLWGYGKVIYIAHPNGYTSVYGHLQKFAPEIEAFIKKLQYEKKSYEVEVFPDYGDLKVQKDQVIAYTGNTGGSSGPHLHFEIRNSISEKPTNPLLYGLEVWDATNPTLVSLFAYPLSANAQVNRSSKKIQIKFNRKRDGSYVADKVYASGTIGFGINTYDRQDLAANKNGVFSVQQIVNGKIYTDYNFESFSFKETRYINTLIDYDHYGKYNRRIQRLFMVPGNRLGIYDQIYNEGKINIKEGLSYNVEIHIKDLANNMVKLIIPIEGKREQPVILKEEKKTDYFIIAKQPNNYDLGAAKVYFPANTFYENQYLDLQKGNDTVVIHNNRIPAHKNFTITFDVSRYSAQDRKELFIARLGKKNKMSYMNTFKRGSTFTTRTRNLGTYTLARDTIPPKIRTKNFREKQWLTNYRYLSLLISDDLSGIDTYTATLNGVWILMEYEPKTKTLTYNFDDKILNQTQCELKVVVTDNVGNTNTFTSTFYRK
ncbi:M23 family metallopeptidase [uncultured Eudoraea sp.]|uniref:M23 family metallopeptidase n=1 Tax=uncultured Eudoraea sp. TaxID=1035614 RepID=UPI002612E786|nr:M23 family metallopeptidase [uncultured Eudoraea sp.]